MTKKYAHSLQRWTLWYRQWATNTILRFSAQYTVMVLEIRIDWVKLCMLIYLKMSSSLWFIKIISGKCNKCTYAQSIIFFEHWLSGFILIRPDKYFEWNSNCISGYQLYSRDNGTQKNLLNTLIQSINDLIFYFFVEVYNIKNKL